MLSERPERAKLFVKYGPQINQARGDLGALSGLHEDFVSDCLTIIRRKQQSLGRPLLGELLPHVISAGIPLAASRRQELAAAWLALYGYTCLVDSSLDRTGKMDARSTMSASALLGWGIATLGRITANTRHATLFLQNVNAAFSGQYRDLEGRSNCMYDRTQSDVDKCRAVVAMVAGYCASSPHNHDHLIGATHLALGPSQILDDLYDVREDIAERNMTPFVRIAQRHASTSELANLDMPALYELIARDPQTILELEVAADGLDNALAKIDAVNDPDFYCYLADLKSGVAGLLELIVSSRTTGGISPAELERRINELCVDA